MYKLILNKFFGYFEANSFGIIFLQILFFVLSLFSSFTYHFYVNVYNYIHLYFFPNLIFRKLLKNINVYNYIHLHKRILYRSTKNRSQVNLSKKKIRAQKKTGFARHGSRTSPIFRGGGHIFNLVSKMKQIKINKKFNKLIFYLFLFVSLQKTAKNVKTKIGFSKNLNLKNILLYNTFLNLNLPLLINSKLFESNILTNNYILNNTVKNLYFNYLIKK